MNKEKEEFLRKTLNTPNQYKDELEKKLNDLRRKRDTGSHSYSSYNYKSKNYRTMEYTSKVVQEQILKDKNLRDYLIGKKLFSNPNRDLEKDPYTPEELDYLLRRHEQGKSL